MFIEASCEIRSKSSLSSILALFFVEISDRSHVVVLADSNVRNLSSDDLVGGKHNIRFVKFGCLFVTIWTVIGQNGKRVALGAANDFILPLTDDTYN